MKHKTPHLIGVMSLLYVIRHSECNLPPENPDIKGLAQSKLMTLFGLTKCTKNYVIRVVGFGQKFKC